MKRILATTLVLMTVLAAGTALAAMKGSADVVKAAAATSVVTGQAGQRIEFAVELDISPKWHIYAHGDTNFIGVDLVPAEGFPLTDFQAAYPHGHKGEFFGEVVYMISGQQRITASALVPAGLKPGEYPLQLAVTVQACDDKTCLAPVDLPVKVSLKIK